MAVGAEEDQSYGTAFDRMRESYLALDQKSPDAYYTETGERLFHETVPFLESFIEQLAANWVRSRRRPGPVTIPPFGIRLWPF